MIVVNIIINILNMILPVFIFNKFNGIKIKINYLIFFIGYIIGFTLINITFKNLIFAYIISSIIFCLFNKNKILSFILMINIILLISILTAIPMLFVGYNNIYIIINQIIIVSIFIISYIFPLNNIYKKIIPNWNRNKNNKIKSITLRNGALISLYLMITLINLFINEYFFTIYKNLM